MQGEKVVYIGIPVLVFIVSFICGFRVGDNRSETVVKRDTTYITKTVREYVVEPARIEYKELVRTEYKTDTLIVRETVHVPVFIHDTLYIPISKYYYEALEGRARMWVTGYNVTLDRVEFDDVTKIVRYRRKWGLSVGTGAGVIYSPFHNGVDAGIGVFGGFTYTF